MNEIKQQQLTWNKGMSNVPSDLICSDNACEGELNMVYRMGEHRPIQEEQVLFGGKALNPLLFMHEYNNYKHYIAMNGNKVMWYDKDGGEGAAIVNAPEIGDDVQVGAIGNTLIVNSSNGLGYYLWKQNENNYKYLGAKIPEPEVRFLVLGGNKYIHVSETIKAEGILKTHYNVPLVGGVSAVLEAVAIVKDKQEEYNNLAVGGYEANKKYIKRDVKGFCNPFFVRYAVEMFDGEYTNISIPYLVIPFANDNTFWVNLPKEDDAHDFHVCTLYARLAYMNKTDYSEWSDLVKKIAIFVSDEAEMYSTDKDQEVGAVSEKMSIDIISGADEESGDIKLKQSGDNILVRTDITSIGYGESTENNRFFQAFSKYRSMKEELKQKSNFYKILEAGTEVSDGWKIVEPRDGDLENLTSLERLQDDYYSNCEKTSDSIYIYNNRVNLTNVKRSFWKGASRFMAYNYISLVQSRLYDIYVEIETGDGNRIVHTSVDTTEQIGRTWFYYPDPRAKKAIIVIDKNKGIYNSFHPAFESLYPDARYIAKEIKLEESEFLNGAYWFGDKPMSTNGELNLGWVKIDNPPAVSVEHESLTGEVMTSEVNNPWVFKAEGANKIGNGKLLGLASQTTALSQGQFGQYPLLAFCTDGIWALQVGNNGLYTSIHPMSREVCNNPQSVTETDGLVFFTSEKGLMVVNGGQVTCVSEQMSGKVNGQNGPTYEGTHLRSLPLDLYSFMKDCMVAYDYRDSLLWILKDGEDYGYVYSIKDGTFGMKQCDRRFMEKTVNAYPDTLLQDSDGKVYSLLERENINLDAKKYRCELVTRPMKLENATALKTIARLKVIYDKTEKGGVTMKIFGSDDCKKWYRVMSTHGRGFKYWKFSFVFADMKAVDTFSGVLANTQERYTERMR